MQIIMPLFFVLNLSNLQNKKQGRLLVSLPFFKNAVVKPIDITI